jgi:DnaJ homolog subfamily C member 2
LRVDRKKVLKHHPDKKAGSTTTETVSDYLGITHQKTNDDAFFKCIQKAHEVLTNPERRRQYDSVDHELLEREERLTGITEKEFKAGHSNTFT